MAALGVGLCIAGLVAIAVVALLRSGTSDRAGGQLPKRFAYDIQARKEIDPALIKYEEKQSIPVAMDAPRAIAVGPLIPSEKPGEKPSQSIYVGGDRKIVVFRPDGTTSASYALEFEPRALAVTRERIYVAARSHIAVLDNNGVLITTWPERGQRALFTSITVDPSENESGGNDVYVADAGNRIVLRYDSDGRLLGEIDRPPADPADPKASRLGFIVPSPFFDVAMGDDGLLRVVNPGRHTIEAYTPQGLLEKPLTWGKRGFDIKGFCGCCNPAAIAILPDGRFVTGEKGLPRVKVYSPQGRFECVVAGPKTLDPTATGAEDTRDVYKLTAVDLAVDSQGRVLVLDPKAKSVRVFVRKDEKGEDR